MEQSAIQQFRTLLTSARSLLIVLPQDPDIDHLGAGLGLYLSLSKNYQTKIVSPSPVTVNHNRLIAVDQIESHLPGSKQLIFTLPHPASHIERVFTEVDPDNNFRIVVEAAAQNPGFITNQVQISAPGDQIDIIILLGARHPDDLGDLLDPLQSLLEQSKIIKIDIASHSPHLDSLELMNYQAVALSEVVYEILKSSQLHLDQDIATNLIAGIEFRTHNFTSPKTTADTFDTIAACLRLGGVRGYAQTPPAATLNAENAPETPETSDNQPFTLNSQPESEVDLQQASPPPAPPEPPVSSNQPPRNPSTPPTPPSNRKGVPDWLVPKIFSGKKTS